MASAPTPEAHAALDAVIAAIELVSQAVDSGKPLTHDASLALCDAIRTVSGAGFAAGARFEREECAKIAKHASSVRTARGLHEQSGACLAVWHFINARTAGGGK